MSVKPKLRREWRLWVNKRINVYTLLLTTIIDKLLQKDIAKDKITTEHAKLTRELVSTTNSLSGLSDVDFVIEAASENLNIKSAIFRDLDAICKPSSILATNTSSISITKIGAATKRPEQVIGMHFMNPVPVMKLVEIIPGLATSADVLKATRDLAEAMGKTTTVVQDIPGFVANRLLMPYINEAVMLLECVSNNKIICITSIDIFYVDRALLLLKILILQ